MNRFLIPSCLLAILGSSTLSAQSCVYVPDNNPAAGALDTRPFGGNAPSQPAQGNHVLLVRVPRTYFPTGRLTLREIGFAAKSSGTRKFTNISIEMGTIPTGQALVPTFWMNHPGFGAVPMGGRQWDWRTTGGQWNHLGWRGTFPYDPSTRDLIVIIRVRGGGLPGTADASFYGDPTLDHVYTGGFVGTPPSTGTVGKGGPKMKICFDFANADVFGRGCPGTNGTPNLEMVGSGRAGTPLTMQIRNGPARDTVMAMIANYRLATAAADLSNIGMPGCYNYTSFPGSIIQNFALRGGRADLGLTVPNFPAAIGFFYFFQFYMVDPGANALGVSSTQVGHLMIGN